METQKSKDILIQVLQKIDERFARQVDVINNHARLIDECTKSIKALSQVQEHNNRKFLKLIALYAELATCGVMDGKRKENLKAEITNLINENKS